MGYLGKKPADIDVDIEDASISATELAANSVDSSELVDGSIDTSHIGDNQVTLAKMAGLARGKIIYGDASGDPAALAVGSNGQVLTSDGTDISWGSDDKLTTEEVQDITGAMFSSNTESGITATYQDGDGTIDLAVGSITSAMITDGTIATADIADDAITSDKLDTNIAIGGTLGVTGAITGTLGTAAQTNITSLGTLTALTVDDITINGSTISDAADLTIDAGGDIYIDADGGDIVFKDGGTDFAEFSSASNHLNIKSSISDADIKFKGNDGGSTITALTLDMSAAGAATFNAGITTTGTVTAASGLFQTERGSASAPTFTFSDDTDTGMYNVSNADLGFTVGGTDRLHIKASGYVGIGTTSPSDTLHVSGGVKINTTTGDGNEARFYFNPGGAADDPAFTIYRHDGSSIGSKFQGASASIGTGTAANTTLGVETAPNTSDIATKGITISPLTAMTSGQFCPLITSSPIGFGSNRARVGIGIEAGSDWGKGNLIFLTANRTDGSAMTSSDERMRIDLDGKVLVGATAAVDGEKFLVNHNGACKMTIRAEENSSARDATLYLHTYSTGAQNRIYFVDGAGAGSGQGQIYYNHDGNIMKFLTAGTDQFVIDSAGNLTATDTSIGAISDQRLKTNIQDYTYSINDFKSYTPRVFDWINPEEHGNKTQQIGFIAQEQEAIDNRFIEETETDPNRKDTLLLDTTTKQDGDVVGVSKTSKFGQKDAMYISVIKQLITRLETAEAKIAVLEG